MSNLLKTAHSELKLQQVSTHVRKKCRHFKSVAKYPNTQQKVLTPKKVSTPLDVTNLFFEYCKGFNQALNGLQPPPTTISTSRPLNISLQQHLEVEK